VSTSPGNVDIAGVSAYKNGAAKNLERFEVRDAKDAQITGSHRKTQARYALSVVRYRDTQKTRGDDEISTGRLNATDVGCAGAGIRGALGVHVLQIQ
jgi:hypothetical protein